MCSEGYYCRIGAVESKPSSLCNVTETCDLDRDECLDDTKHTGTHILVSIVSVNSETARNHKNLSHFESDLLVSARLPQILALIKCYYPNFCNLLLYHMTPSLYIIGGIGLYPLFVPHDTLISIQVVCVGRVVTVRQRAPGPGPVLLDTTTPNGGHPPVRIYVRLATSVTPGQISPILKGWNVPRDTTVNGALRTLSRVRMESSGRRWEGLMRVLVRTVLLGTIVHQLAWYVVSSGSSSTHSSRWLIK